MAIFKLHELDLGHLRASEVHSLLKVAVLAARKVHLSLRGDSDIIPLQACLMVYQEVIESVDVIVVAPFRKDNFTQPWGVWAQFCQLLIDDGGRRVVYDLESSLGDCHDEKHSCENLVVDLFFKIKFRATNSPDLNKNYDHAHQQLNDVVGNRLSSEPWASKILNKRGSPDLYHQLYEQNSAEYVQKEETQL